MDNETDELEQVMNQKLTQEDVAALAWASAAVNGRSKPSPYSDEDVNKLVAMSFVIHQMLDYEEVSDVRPPSFDIMDVELNNTFYPETREERAWGIKRMTHQNLDVDVDKDASHSVYVDEFGSIITRHSEK